MATPSGVSMRAEDGSVGTFPPDSQIEADLRAIILSVAGQGAYATVELERAHGCRTSATLRIRRPLTRTHFSGQNDKEEVIYSVVEGSVSLAVRKLLDYAESWVTARFGRDA